MKVLITGGTGSLGSLLVEHFTQRGASVRIVSRDPHKQAALLQKFPKLDARLGDIRDAKLMQRAMRDIDVVIHAAALKRIERGETDPEEYFSVNTVGSALIADVAEDAGVGLMLLISSDKSCLDYHSPVTLADGSTLSIGKIVADRKDCLVRSIDGNGNVVSARVVGWHKNPRAGRALFRIKYKYGRKIGQSHGGVLATGDHLIMLGDGSWRRADEISNGDGIYTSELCPNAAQMAFIMGCVMGDSHITNRRRSTMKFSHCAKQIEWLNLKRSILHGFDISDTTVRRDPYEQLSFCVHASAWLSELRDSLYPDGRKIINRELFPKYLNPILLATWYMDDGCKSDNLARIATHGFTRSDVEYLAVQMSAIGMESKAYDVTVAGHIYTELRFSSSGSRKLFSTIGCLIPESMRHKIPEWCEPYNASMWNLGDPVPYVGTAIVEKLIDPRTPREFDIPLPQDNRGKTHCKRGHPLFGDNIYVGKTGSRQCKSCQKMLSIGGAGEFRRNVYCIDVENTHNFIVQGVVVHNCDPLNNYGLSKRMAEELWLTHPGASCLRYGNVMDSVGSFWWAWNAAVAAGQPLRVREPDPTRFFLIRKEAIALVDDAVGSMLGHEILIPKDMYAVSMHDIARELQDESLWLKEPLSLGEKRHESLIGVAEHATGTVGRLLAKVEKTYGGDMHYTSEDVPRLTGKQVVEILRSQT